MIEPETAGDPMSKQKWVRSSLRHLSQRLEEVGHRISPPTVGRILRKLGYALHVNVKRQEASAAHPDRNTQFAYIQAQKESFQAANCPIISVDTKKKELIGNFKNAGRAWTEQPEAVNAHDFPQDAVGKAVPYGIYDVLRNCGTVYVGSSADTPEFAVAAIVQWWEDEGCLTYPDAKEILILADSGGSNGCRPRLWKQQLQEHISDRYGLAVTVAHYPTGCSKWNPIEHRLFSQISLNWAGIPLRSFETALNYIRGTTTQAGLAVRASLLEGVYAKGQKVSDMQMQQLNIEFAEVCSRWNYTLRPRPQISLRRNLELEVIF
jgi:hypothetical protein